MTDRNEFLLANVKNIYSWGHGFSTYRPLKPAWVYEIGGASAPARSQTRDSWQVYVCSTQFDITEQEDRLSGVSARPTIKPRPANIEIQPIELEFVDQPSPQQGPFSMKPIGNDVMLEPIETFLPIPVMRIVCNQLEQSVISVNYNSFMEQTPRPLPASVQIFSAVRQHGTPQAPWTLTRATYDNSCFASPQIQPILDDVSEMVRPPKLPKK